MSKRKTRPIRVDEMDHELWKEACAETRMKSAELFKKLLNSKEIAFKERVRLESEARKRRKFL